MIYITKTIDNDIVTDNVTDFIPDNLAIYFDDILINTYPNISTSILYLKFSIPSIDIENFQEKEYKLNIYNHSALIKQELMIIKENNSLEVTSINKTNNIVMYE